LTKISLFRVSTGSISFETFDILTQLRILATKVMIDTFRVFSRFLIFSFTLWQKQSYRVWNKSFSVTNETTCYVGGFPNLNPSYWLLQKKQPIKIWAQILHLNQPIKTLQIRKNLRKSRFISNWEMCVSDTVHGFEWRCPWTTKLRFLEICDPNYSSKRNI